MQPSSSNLTEPYALSLAAGMRNSRRVVVPTEGWSSVGSLAWGVAASGVKEQCRPAAAPAVS
jgi:hypothetical protein